MAINLSTTRSNGFVVIAVKEDRIDGHNSSELKNFFLALLNDGELNLVVDLAVVRFIDSTGLGVLLSGHKNASLRNGNFYLASLQPQIMSMFELTRLHRVFHIYPNIDEALESE